MAVLVLLCPVRVGITAVDVFDGTESTGNASGVGIGTAGFTCKAILKDGEEQVEVKVVHTGTGLKWRDGSTS